MRDEKGYGPYVNWQVLTLAQPLIADALADARQDGIAEERARWEAKVGLVRGIEPPSRCSAEYEWGHSVSRRAAIAILEEP